MIILKLEATITGKRDNIGALTVTGIGRIYLYIQLVRGISQSHMTLWKSWMGYHLYGKLAVGETSQHCTIFTRQIKQLQKSR